MFEKSFKNLSFSLNGKHPKFTVLFHFGAQFTAGKPKILLKTKISSKTTSLRISNSVSSGSQNNHRILVKLNKNNFFGPNLGLNCHLWPHQMVIRNYHTVYNRDIPLHVLYTKFQFLCLSFLTIPRRSAKFFGFSTFSEKHNYFWLYLGFFRVQMGNGPRLKDQEVTA